MLKKQKGITLIALIITIIVMLILVGVTINVALNGGLFTKAETATRQTEEKAILEEMLAMMEITDEGKINAEVIINKMKEKYAVGGSIPNITITGKLGTYNYIVSETEIKISNSSEGEGGAQLELIKVYFLGAIDESTGERPGIDLKTSETIIAEPSVSELLNASTSQIKFKDNNIILDAYDNMSVISMGQTGENYYMNIKYNGIIYKVIADSNLVTTDVIVAMEEIADTKIYGTDTLYYRVLFNDKKIDIYYNKVKLISVNYNVYDDITKIPGLEEWSVRSELKNCSLLIDTSVDGSLEGKYSFALSSDTNMLYNIDIDETLREVYISERFEYNPNIEIP